MGREGPTGTFLAGKSERIRLCQASRVDINRQTCTTYVVRGSASTGGSTQSVKGIQDVKMSDPTSKGSEEPSSQSKSSEDGKEPPSDARERERVS